MKIPPGILDPKGQAAKGVVYLEANGDDVREYGLTVDGNHSTCYVLVAPEDVITANLSVNSGVSAEFADLVVDGVLRNTWPNTRGARILRYAFDRAVYTGVQIGETKKWKTYAKMKVIERDSFKGSSPVLFTHNEVNWANNYRSLPNWRAESIKGWQYRSSDLPKRGHRRRDRSRCKS